MNKKIELVNQILEKVIHRGTIKINRNLIYN